MARPEAIDTQEWDRTYAHGEALVTEALQARGGRATTDELFETPPIDTLRYPDAAKEAALDGGVVHLGRFGTTLTLTEYSHDE